MSKSKKWEIIADLGVKKKEVGVNDIVSILLENRGLKDKKAVDAFLHPQLEDVTCASVGIDQKELQKALKRIKKAIKEQEQIIVFGDYDVDGITGSAILWETLHDLGAKCLPYIPNRVEEGYGLSIKGIESVERKIFDIGLIITVDNGIVAHAAVDIANEKKIDVIITDHHTVSETRPNAHAIVHTTNLCGAGVAYLLSKELRKDNGFKEVEDTHLELAALGTVADLVPLQKANRTIVMYGLEKLRTTNRIGLVSLFNQSGIKQDEIGVYDIGYIIGPRLNAAGRIDSAMDSLRLLCTKDRQRATMLASKLELTNKERQFLLKEAADHALMHVNNLPSPTKHILVVGHETYQEGVIGLVAGKLVEAYYRPAIVLSIGETTSKASARSVNGFNIIDFLRSHHEHFINVGGHPMAAGFTVETAKIQQLQEALEETAAEMLTEEILTRSIKVDMELSLSVLSDELYQKMQQLSPFGMANPEPVFASRGVTIENIRVLGKEAQHLKLMVSQDGKSFEAIAFGMGEKAAELTVGDKIDIAYVLDENTWNGSTKLQLKVRDLKY